MTIRDESARGSVIVTAMTSSLQLIRIISTILLARLLEPAHFGVIAMANLVVMGMGIFAGLGLSQALIATRKNVGKSALQVLCMTSATGLAFSLAMYSSASLFAGFFEQPELIDVCKVLSIVVLIQALKIVPDALLVKEMLFARRVIPKISASLTGIGVSLYLAYSGYGIWSLVFGSVSSSVIALLGLIIVVPDWSWIRSTRWSWSDAKELLRIGMHNLSTWLTQYFYNNFDHMVVAKSLGATQLGFYSQAITLSKMPVTMISAAINSVLLPAYSKISDDHLRLQSAYLESLRVMAAIISPIALGILVVAPEAVIVLIGEKWRGAIPILQVFAFMSLIRPLSGTTSPLFLSLGKPQYNFRTAMIQATVLVLIIWPALRWGATGAAMAVVVAFLAGYAHNIYVMCRKLGIGLSTRKIAQQIWPSLSASGIMAIVVSILKRIIVDVSGPIDDLLTLFLIILAGGITYVVSLFLVSRQLVFDIYRLINNSIFKKAA